MFVTKVVILSIISYASGASVKLDNSNLQAMVAEAVQNLLRDGRTGENTASILKEVNDLKTKNIRHEQRIDFLEHEKRDKDMLICSVWNNMKKLVESISNNNGGKAQNLTVNSSFELPSKCSDLKSVAFENEFSGMETLQRTKRDVVAVPTRNIAFSAYLSQTHSNMSPNEAIKFDQILLNDGHGYNSYTGAFVAPVSGTYLFTFHIHSRVHTFARLNVDGVNSVDAVVNPHTGLHERETMSGNTIIIHVGIGQAVSVEVYDVSGEAASSSKYRLCTFSGVFLYPE